MGPRKALYLFGEVAGRQGGALVVRVGPHTIQATYEGTLDAGAAVSVVLRAESATLHRTAPPDRINAVSGRIAYTVSLGTNAEYEGRLADDSGLRVVERIPSGVPSFRDGDPVVVAWSPEDTIVLPGSRASLEETVA